MKKTFILSCFSLLFSSLTIHSENIIEYVNPIIGTNGMGHTFPGACVPFGVVQLSPDTDTIPHNVNGKYQGKVYEADDFCDNGTYGDIRISLFEWDYEGKKGFRRGYNIISKC